MYLTTSVPSTLSNGVKLEDGEAEIALFYGYTPQIPITIFDFTTPTGNDLKYVAYKGNVEIVKNDGSINRINLLPYGDSLQLSIAFVPQKKGTYTFYIQSMFYEGKKGKTRTQPSFINTNHNFDELWSIPGETFHPGEQGYDSRYYFAVTD